MNVKLAQNLTDFTYQQLAPRLDQGQQVLWLIPGGSVIPLAVEIMNRLQAHPLSHLSITLTDERYGAPGHPDENYAQLNQAGFQPGAALWQPVNTGLSIAQETQRWQDFLQNQLDQADFSLGLFGIGPDGHTAGLLPHSSTLSSSALADHYQGPDHTRITTTPTLISQLHLSLAYATGQAKWTQLQRLISQDLSLAIQPAQILKQAHQAILFTDLP